MGTKFIWIDVGCLECGNPTTYRGWFATEQEARGAVASDAFPSEPVLLRKGEDPPENVWHGQGVHVLVVLGGEDGA